MWSMALGLWRPEQPVKGGLQVGAGHLEAAGIQALHSACTDHLLLELSLMKCFQFSHRDEVANYAIPAQLRH